MPKAAKKAAAKAVAKVYQKVNVDFYRVADSAGGKLKFRDALLELKARQGALRRTLVRGEYIDLHHIEQHGTIIEGEVGRLRKYDLPAISGKDCITRDLDLEDEESVTERTAFLFDSKNGILAMHAKREAVSASKIAHLCDEIQKNIGEFFELQVVLTPDARAKFEKMSSYRSFRVKYASAAEGKIKRPDKTTQKLLSSLGDTDGAYINIEIGAGPKKGDKLNFGIVNRVLSKAETIRNEGVAELKVTGRGAADEMLVVNLIRDRMRNFRSIEVVGGSTSYEQRRVAVRECYEGQSGNFKAEIMAQDKQSLSQRWEDNYPSVLSAMGTATGAFILVRHCEWIQPFIGGVIKLAPSTLNVSAIAVGFLATAQALLLSLGNTKALIALKETSITVD